MGKTTLAKAILSSNYPNGRYFNWDFKHVSGPVAAQGGWLGRSVKSCQGPGNLSKDGKGVAGNFRENVSGIQRKALYKVFVASGKKIAQGLFF